jgi:glycosyltransferase involved in cell wall biosynthesis
MKVALVNRSSMNRVRGGDTTQIMNTARELKKLGVTPHIYLASEKINYDQYDLLHFFNIIRPADHLYHSRRCRKPYVVSTIYLDYETFDTYGRTGWQKLLFSSMGKYRAEYLKTIYRALKGQDKLVSWEYLLGHRRAKRILLENAAILLPNSQSEYYRVRKLLSKDIPFVSVPNGIDESMFRDIPPDVVREQKVMCAAQVYGRKNQLELIRICNELDYPLDIIGKAPPNHMDYMEQCRAEAGPGVRFLDFIPQQELFRNYASAKVHALPSWFETTGLSSLEAGALGCNLVVGSGGDTADYFKGYAQFCDAADRESIKKAVEAAMNQPTGDALREKILSEYTWKNAAVATLKGYELALQSR